MMFKYAKNGYKGFINTNITDLESSYQCDIFDDKGNYFNMMVRSKDPAISLGEICTILSTLKVTKG